MQASVRWTPPRGTLGALVAAAEARVAGLQARRRELESAAAAAQPAPLFARRLTACAHLSVIAEIKRRSPSKGSINPTLGAAEQALAYQRGGATALSVLTEPEQFGGSPADLTEVVRASRLPALKKDFHVDRLQLVEARALGASAVLLIARAVAPPRLADLAQAARDLGLEVVIEIRDEPELERALACAPEAIGVNNRDLETLTIDRSVGDRLLPTVPVHVAAICESGVITPDDVRRAAAAGADAVLVGSMLSAAPDPEAAVRSLVGAARTSHRSPRGG